MLNPEDIHQQAEEKRRKQAAQHRKQHKASAGKRFFPLSSESRTVFHRIYPHSPNFLITFLLPTMLFVTGLVLWYIDRKRFSFLTPWMWGLPAIPLLTWLYYSLKELLDYRHYKTWRSNLGFTVHGWEELGQSSRFPKWKFWDRNTSVQIRVKPQTDTATLRLLNDLLYLYTIKANNTYYAADHVQPGAAGDLRRKWQHSGELEVSGSANSSVMGQLYLFIDLQLRAAQQQTSSIESVTIRYSKDILEIQSLQVSD